MTAAVYGRHSSGFRRPLDAKPGKPRVGSSTRSPQSKGRRSYPYTRGLLLLLFSAGLAVAGCACDPRHVAQMTITSLFVGSVVVGVWALWPLTCRLAALIVADMGE